MTVIFAALYANQALAELIDGEEFIDPTRPIFATGNTEDSSLAEMIRTVVPASYDLTFVRAGSSSPIAVINNQQVTIGDMIGGALVVAIERSSVTLLINDEEKRINLYGSIKSPVSVR